MPRVSDPEPPLDYRNRDDDRPPFDVRGFVLGLLVGIVLVGCAGAPFAFVETARRGPRPAHPFLPQALTFLAVAVAAGVGVTILVRGDHGRRRAALLGLLIAVGAASLIEGTCFSLMS